MNIRYPIYEGVYRILTLDMQKATPEFLQGWFGGVFAVKPSGFR